MATEKPDFNPSEADAPKGKAKGKKLTGKERKGLKKKQLAYEKKLVEAGEIPPRRHAPRSPFGRMIALSLAFLFGVISLPCGFLIAGMTVKTKTMFSVTGIEYSDYITDSVADMTLLELVTDIKETSFTNLNSFGKYTPVLRNTLENTLSSFETMGVYVDVSSLMNTDFGELGSFFQDEVLMNIVLGEALKLTPSSESSLFITLCYGVEGEDYIVENDTFVMLDGKSPLTVAELLDSDNLIDDLLDRITVESVLSIDASSDAALRYLAYGTENEQYGIVDGEIVMLTDPATGEEYKKRTLKGLTESENLLGGMTIGDVIDTENADGLMKAISSWTLDDLSNGNRIKRLKISQIIDIDSSSSLLMQALSDWRIGDLTEQQKIDSLTLADILELDESSPMILRTLANTAIGDFGDAVDNLRLSEILDAEDISGNKLLKNLGNSTLTSLSQDIQNLTVADVFGDEMYSYLVVENDVYYEDIVLDYINKGRFTEDGSGNIPSAIVPETVTEQRLLQDGTQVVAGYFALRGNAYFLIDAADVFAVSTESGKTYYAQTEKAASPEYTWKIYDYDLGANVSLGDGNSVGTDTAGYTDGTVPLSQATTPALNGDGDPLYFLSGETGVYYPVWEDGLGYYFYRMTADGAKERVDLDRIVSGYTFSYGDKTSKLTLGEDGKLYFADTEKFGSDPVTVHRRKAEDGSEAYYFKLREEVTEKYYVAQPDGGELKTEYAASDLYVTEDITVRYTALVENETVVVDRYLSGVWYLLFCEEVYDENGKAIGIASNANVPILEISDSISKVAETINTTPLWQLYLHGFLESNPFLDISSFNYKDTKNLNELTITGAIAFMKAAIGNTNG